MSHSQIRRETIQRGGTLDDAQAEIERTEGTSEARWCTCGDSTSVDAKGVCPVHGGESPAEPNVEQMIEEIGDVRVFRVPSGWSATEPGSHKYHYGDTPREAVAALYRAWRERE